MKKKQNKKTSGEKKVTTATSTDTYTSDNLGQMDKFLENITYQKSE